MNKTFRAVLAFAAVASLGACAPAMNLAVTSPGCGPDTPWTRHSRTSVHAVTQRIQRVQAQYRMGFRYEQRNPGAWRSAATGECR